MPFPVLVICNENDIQYNVNHTTLVCQVQSYAQASRAKEPVDNDKLENDKLGKAEDFFLLYKQIFKLVNQNKRVLHCNLLQQRVTAASYEVFQLCDVSPIQPTVTVLFVVSSPHPRLNYCYITCYEPLARIWPAYLPPVRLFYALLDSFIVRQAHTIILIQLEAPSALGQLPPSAHQQAEAPQRPTFGSGKEATAVYRCSHLP